MKSDILIKTLDKLYPNAKCELNYSKDYEVLIATVLSAQSTDRVVNKVTPILFSLYDIFSLANASLSDIEKIIYPVGTYKNKAKYIVEIAKSLVLNYDGVVPNNRAYLESLPGVGRKTCNVVLSNIYGVSAIAVDTHVKRASSRLGLTNSSDVLKIENDLMNFLPSCSWSKVHHQLVLFGRYICKSKNPLCDNCPFVKYCKEKRP